MLESITPLILTYNEAPNIGRTLEKLAWARDIVVVDSFSTDETPEIVASFTQARMIQRRFDSFASQCNFGLTETGIATDWVLSLDADYVLTSELVDELGTLRPDSTTVGFRANFTYCIFGRRLRSGIYPPVTVLFRRSGAYFKEDGHAHRVVVSGDVKNLSQPVLHDDRKSLSRWLEGQSRYTKLEAEKLLSANPESLGWTDRVRRWRVVAPAAMLFYCLIIRAGVFDGWPGFYYAFQRVLAELMLSLHLLDHDLRNSKFGIRNARTEQPRPNPREVEDATTVLSTSQFEIRNPKSEIRNL